MKTVLKLAWRNIWRNKRRTLITAASVLFSVFFAGLLSSLQSGVWDNMIGNVVNYYYGFAQVQDSTYWANKDINHAFSIKALEQQLPQNPNLKGLVPRFENFALVSYGNETQGALIVGIAPQTENKMTNLSNRVVKGSFLSPKDSGVLIAQGIADKVKLEIGDSLVVISQGYHGINSAGLFQVKGILHFPSPELNRQMIYMSLNEAQEFFGAPGMATSLALQIDNQAHVARIVKQLRKKLSSSWVVKDWKQLMPDLVSARAIDTASARLILMILYVIITFGIFGTVLMMLEERTYEFGVLLSIGLKRFQLFLMVWLELLFMAFIGVFTGLLLAYGMAIWFYYHPIQLGKEMAQAYAEFGMSPIMPASLHPNLFLAQAAIIFGVVVVLSIYPFIQIKKLKPVDAMHE